MIDRSATDETRPRHRHQRVRAARRRLVRSLAVLAAALGAVVGPASIADAAPAVPLDVAVAQDGAVLPEVDPASVDMSAERLDRLSAYLDGVVGSGLLPGSITMVARRGGVVHLETDGWMDANQVFELTPEHLFRMYSMTKPITSVAILVLMEEGRLLLDDPVADYLPAFADAQVLVDPDTGETVPAERPITIRDLLTHTSGTIGLGEALADPAPVELDSTSPMSELVDRIAALPLRSQPGERFEYGFGHDIAGVVVENVSGMTLDEFFADRIFGPLAMDDTAFYVPEGDEAMLVDEMVPEPAPGGIDWVAALPGTFSSDKVGESREQFGGGGWGGGVVSTIGDYASFAQMLANDGELGGVRVLSPKSVELMTTSHTGDLATAAGPGYGFGLGVGVRTDLTSRPLIGSVGRYGWGGAAFTTFFVDPAEELVALRFANVFGIDQLPGGADINPLFETFVYGALN
ncbi:MAG: serine hydrolase domain-containing protein [Actinomycetota bacterium]|nr:serine hydrolase domain-containing protein [Actinomycetota bacterium]